MQDVKLGKAPKKEDHRNLKLSNYMKVSALPILPSMYSWTYKVVDWLMLANSSVGDCTIAGLLHYFMGVIADNGGSFVPTDQQAITIYSDVTGYVPGNESTDNGAAELDVLNFNRKNGFLGHSVAAFAEIDITNLDLIKYAVYLFGASYIGVQLPLTANGATSWEVPSIGTTGDGAPGSWGGHAIIITAFDDTKKEFTVITWGQPMQMSYDFWSAYGEEAYALISNDFVTGEHPSPGGFDINTLNADLQSL